MCPSEFIFPAVEGILMWRRMTAPNGELQFIIADNMFSNRWQRSMLSLAAGSQVVTVTDFGSSSSTRARKVIPGRRLLFTLTI